MPTVLSKEEYRSIEKQLEEYLTSAESHKERKNRHNRYTEFLNNKEMVFDILTEAPFKWEDSGDWRLGNSEQTTTSLLRKASYNYKDRGLQTSTGKALALLQDFDLVGREERQARNKWKLSNLNYNEIEKYYKAISEVGDKIMDKVLNESKN
jgi:hypothetical protein